MEAFLAYCYEKGYFNGVWIFIKKGEVISKGVLGKAHPYNDRMLDTDTVFEMASVSKHFTATAIMILRDKGMLSLEDSLQKYIPGAAYQGITVRHMLNHTSGLPDYFKWVTELGKQDNTIYPNTVIERFILESGLPSLFTPGEIYSYCNTAYSILALIVEKVSGKSFAGFMRDEIFVPCGMMNSCVYHRRMQGETISNYAYGMVLSDGKYMLPDDVEESNYVIPLDGVEGDGIVNTTLDDIHKWDIAQREQTVLSLASQQEMCSDTVLNDGSTYPYGYGWRLVNDADCGLAVTHGGGWPGYNTRFLRLLEENTMAAVFCNQTGCDGMARSEMFEGVAEITFGREPKLPKTFDEHEDTSVDPASFNAYCGVYKDTNDVTVTIYLCEGKLHITHTIREREIDCDLVATGSGSFLARIGYLKILLDGQTVTMTIDEQPRVFYRESN